MKEERAKFIGGLSVWLSVSVRARLHLEELCGMSIFPVCGLGNISFKKGQNRPTAKGTRYT